MRSVKEYFSFLYKAYISILVIPCLFLLFALVTTESNRFSEHDIPYLIADEIVMLIGIIFVYSYSQKQIKVAKGKRGLREKLFFYRKAILISGIILANISFFSIVCYIISGEHFFVCTTVFTMVILILNKPSITNLIDKIDLEDDEQRILENPKSAI